MKSLIIIFLVCTAEVFTGRIDRFSQTHKDDLVPPTLMPVKYAYKEVILYLTPSEIRALESQNILKHNHDDNSMYLVNSPIPPQEQGRTVPTTFKQPQSIKPVEELQEDTPVPNKHTLINVPFFYPFQLIPLRDIEKEKSQNAEWIHNEQKKSQEEHLHKFEHQNSWAPILGKPNTPTLLPTHNKEEETLDNLLRLQYDTNNYHTAKTLRIEDLHKLQHDLEQQLAFAHKSYPFSEKASISNTDIPATKLPSYSQLNHDSIDGYHNSRLRIIRPLSKEESSENVDEIAKHRDLYKPEPINNINRSFQTQLAFVNKKKALETH